MWKLFFISCEWAFCVSLSLSVSLSLLLYIYTYIQLCIQVYIRLHIHIYIYIYGSVSLIHDKGEWRNRSRRQKITRYACPPVCPSARSPDSPPERHPPRTLAAIVDITAVTNITLVLIGIIVFGSNLAQTWLTRFRLSNLYCYIIFVFSLVNVLCKFEFGIGHWTVRQPPTANGFDTNPFVGRRLPICM